MYNVSFPGLGIDLDISNSLSIGNFTIYWYGIIIAVGLILAVIYGCANSKRFGIDADSLLNCVMVGVITGILGARAYYVIFNWDYYGSHLDKILAINEGGLAIYGGIIGALLGGLIVGKICKMNLPALLDVAAIGFLIGQGIGRWGNFFNQEAYGIATDLPWGMVSEGTNNIAVHPCFLYESIWCLLGVLLLHLFSHSKMRKYNGQIAILYLVWYGLERAIVETLRTDSLMIPGTDNVRVSMVLSLIMVVAGIFMLIFFRLKGLNNLSLATAVNDNNDNETATPQSVASTLGLDDVAENTNDEVTNEKSQINESEKTEEEIDIDSILNDVKKYTE